MIKARTKRFSDAELLEMHDELKTLTYKVDDISNVVEIHINEESVKFNAMIEAVNDNTQSIKILTERTAGSVEFHEGARQFVDSVNKVQRALVWLTKWGVIGASLAALYNYIIHLFE